MDTSRIGMIGTGDQHGREPQIVPSNEQNCKPFHDHSLKHYLLELTSRPPLYFCPRPRKAAKSDRATPRLISRPAALTNE